MRPSEAEAHTDALRKDLAKAIQVYWADKGDVAPRTRFAIEIGALVETIGQITVTNEPKLSTPGIASICMLVTQRLSAVLQRPRHG